MKNRTLVITDGQAERLCSIMIAVGCFTAMVIDGEGYLNSSWLCIIVGFIIALPLLIAINRLSSNAKPSKLWVIAALYMVFQSAATLRLIINSVSYSNVIIMQPMILTVVMLLVSLYIIMKNGSGIGNAAKIGSLFAIVLFTIIFICNIGYMNVRWLFPIMGPGKMKILGGSVQSAGIIVSAALIHIPAEKGSVKKQGVLRSGLVGAIFALLLCLYSELLSPVQPASFIGRLQNIEMILSNGRTSLGVQLPVSTLWFVGYIMALASYAFSGALLISYAFNGIKIGVSGILCTLTAFLLAVLGAAESKALNAVNTFSYIVVWGIILAFMIGGKKYGRRTA